MFDQLYTLADGLCVYQGSTKQLVPFLGTLGLQCPSYHNPASYIIEVACGEYGDNTNKLVAAISNGKEDIRLGKPFPELKKGFLNNEPKEVKAVKNVNENAGDNNKDNLQQNNVYLRAAINEISKDIVSEYIVFFFKFLSLR